MSNDKQDVVELKKQVEGLHEIISDLTKQVREVNSDNSRNHESWSMLKIMAEFVDATEKLRNVPPCVSIFGSARTPVDDPYYKLTEEIARLLSDAGYGVISGGGPGIMEAANKGAYGGKSPSIGLNIILPMEQSFNRYQNISINFKHFFTRKVMFAKFASAYVVMPGGFGTIDEMSEVLTLIQTGKTKKIPVVLVGKEFWQGFISWVNNTLLTNKMISPEDLSLFTVTDNPEEVVETICEFYRAKCHGLTPAECQAIL